LAYSLPFVPAGLALWVVGLLDRFFLVEYAGTSETGLYHIANSIAGVTAIIVAGFLQAWSPFAFSIKDDSGAKNTYSAALQLFVGAGCAVSVIASLFAPEILRILTAPSYYPAFDVVGLLCLANILLGVYQIVGIGLALVKRTMPIFYGTILAACFNIALNFLLIPTYGRTGAAWATLISALIIPVYLFFPAQRYYFIPYRIVSVSFIFAVSLAIILTGNLFSAEMPYILPIKFAVVLIYLGAVFFMMGVFGKRKFFETDII
jgi:O-antigen/teichoic acid export membrane protein